MTTEQITNKNIRILVSAILGMVLLPYVGEYIHAYYINGHWSFPPEYFIFPPLLPRSKASFNPIVFGAVALVLAGLILFFIFPQIFGFKKNAITLNTAPEIKGKQSVSLPYWFWLGLLTWGATLITLWCNVSQPAAIVNWAAIFLFWGFTFVLDGIVYKRTGGISLIKNAPREIIGIGVASVFGWLLFEFLNFFVNNNWCYPFGNLLPTSEFCIYAVIGSSGLMPMGLEWYSLFNTFDKFTYKYSYGPKIIFAEWVKTTLIVISLIIMFAIPFFPSITCASLWVAPMIILTGILSKIKIWTPFKSVKNGNWSPLVLITLTYGIQGLLCEFWNYYSGRHDSLGHLSTTCNPDYWTYSIPYVDKFHLFEMPLLGYMGYLPFGIYCTVWWIVCAYLLNIPTKLLDFPKNQLPEDQ